MGLLNSLRELAKILEKMDDKGERFAVGKGKEKSGDVEVDYEYSIELGLGEKSEEEKEGPGFLERREKHRKTLHFPSEEEGEGAEVKELKDLDLKNMDIIKRVNYTTIITELVGVRDEDDIDVELEGDSNKLQLNIKTEKGKLEKNIPLTDKEVARIEDVLVKNNVLEIKLKNTKEKKKETEGNQKGKENEKEEGEQDG